MRGSRNYNPEIGMHHLFIRIYAEGLINDVEPWTSTPLLFDMKTIWGEKYDPNCNIYGETKRWLTDGEG